MDERRQIQHAKIRILDALAITATEFSVHGVDGKVWTQAQSEVAGELRQLARSNAVKAGIL